MSDNTVVVTDDNFATEVLQSEIPVIVDFWAVWCGPCKMFAPTFDEAAKDYLGKVKFAKLNVDENNATPSSYGVRGIPTIIMFKGGKIAATKTGAMSKQQLVDFVTDNVT